MRPAVLAALSLATAAFATAACDRHRLVNAFADEAGAPLPPGATPVASGAPPPPPPLPAQAPPVSTALANGAPMSFAPIAHAADPSVVTINTIATEVEVSPFTGRGRQAVSRGLGTGFVFDKNGIILTNNHVVEGAQQIEVQLSDERRFPGVVKGTDQATDIAVLQIDAKDLPTLPLGDSDRTDVGDWVVAIGNPFGLSHTVSAGIISAKGRTKEDVPLDPAGYYDFLQTDASINPGNSGGPLLNLKGEVVGMNSAIRGGGAQGIGFAIPINMIKQLLPMLLRDGYVTRSAIGVRMKDVRELGPDDRAALKLAANATGAVVIVVMPGGAADKAQLQPGDVIIGFEGTPIERVTQLQWLSSMAGVGRPVTLRVQRDGKPFDIKLTLGRLGDTGGPPGPAQPRSPGPLVLP
jgi:serine protease Do